MGKAQHSHQAKLYAAAFGTANPAGSDPEGASFSEVAEVISINGMPLNHSVTRVTHLSSPRRAHEKIPGLLDAGQITFRVNQTTETVSGQATNYTALAALMPTENDTSATGWGNRQWVIQFPDGSQWYATAFIQGMPFDVPEDDRITTEVTLEISGRPDFTP